MKSFVLLSQNILALYMKYKCLQGMSFPLFFKLVNIDTKSKPSATGYHLNCHFISHNLHSIMKFKVVNTPISKIKNIFHSQNNSC